MTVITIQLPGAPGSPGPQGVPGPAGPGNALTIGTVSTLGSGVSASATITGTSPNQILNLGIPTGPQGAAGAAASMSIGTITTGAAGSNASATLGGTAPNYTLNLTIPRGATGATGPTGNTGATGQAGPANSLTIGTVSTLSAGVSASATITGTAPNQVLNLSIPQGAQGIQGPAGANGTNGTNGVGFPVGGATGTILTKNSSSDFDTAWIQSSATSTPSTHVIRDTAGRTQFADPSALADAATKNYVDTKVTTHANLTTAHGTTSTIVGISDTQTLTNKTISLPFIDKPKLTNYFDVGTAATPAAPAASTYRMNVSTAGVLTMQGSTGAVRQISVQWPTTATTFVSTAAQGDTQYHSVFQCVFVYDGANWRQISRVVLTAESDFTTYKNSLASAGITPHAGFRVFVASSGVERGYWGTTWAPSGGTPLFGKLMGTGSATFLPLTYNAGYTVPFPTSSARLSGGVTAPSAGRLQLPEDGLWEVSGRGYLTVGSGQCAFSVWRTRSSVADAAVVPGDIFLKYTGARDQPACHFQDTVPLKAGDQVYLQALEYDNNGMNTYINNESFGCVLQVRYIGPLNGATPI